MLIVNSYQVCVKCNNKFIVTSEHYYSGRAKCPWCSADYEIIERNVSAQNNYVEIELMLFNFGGNNGRCSY
jgi:DNA-binding helix-hairpin-helix protein with protein kinase domain